MSRAPKKFIRAMSASKRHEDTKFFQILFNSLHLKACSTLLPAVSSNKERYARQPLKHTSTTNHNKHTRSMVVVPRERFPKKCLCSTESVRGGLDHNRIDQTAFAPFDILAGCNCARCVLSSSIQAVAGRHWTCPLLWLCARGALPLSGWSAVGWPCARWNVRAYGMQATLDHRKCARDPEGSQFSRSRRQAQTKAMGVCAGTTRASVVCAGAAPLRPRAAAPHAVMSACWQLSAAPPIIHGSGRISINSDNALRWVLNRADALLRRAWPFICFVCSARGLSAQGTRGRLGDAAGTERHENYLTFLLAAQG